MSLSERPSAYGPILRALLNQAVTSTAGISLEVKSESEAIQTRQRLYKVRELENKNIKKTFGAEYAGPWDPIRILVEKINEKWHVILTKDEILLGQVKVTDLATGQALGVAGDLMKSNPLNSPVEAAVKDPFEGDES